MTQSQGTPVPRRCPRCGGAMYQPSGSLLYWHADNNHPRCDITNVIDPPVAVQAPSEDESPKLAAPPKSERKKK